MSASRLLALVTEPPPDEDVKVQAPMRGPGCVPAQGLRIPGSWPGGDVHSYKQTQAVREQFDRGVFYDCRSAPVVLQLLRTFFRELPAPLLPNTMYPEALAIVSGHVRRSWADLR